MAVVKSKLALRSLVLPALLLVTISSDFIINITLSKSVNNENYSGIENNDDDYSTFKY